MTIHNFELLELDCTCTLIPSPGKNVDVKVIGLGDDTDTNRVVAILVEVLRSDHPAMPVGAEVMIPIELIESDEITNIVKATKAN